MIIFFNICTFSVNNVYNIFFYRNWKLQGDADVESSRFWILMSTISNQFIMKVRCARFSFFKLELYKYLSLFFLVFFSIITLYINCFILSFLGSVFAPILKFSGLWLLIIIMFFNIFLLQQGLTNLKFYQFIALSSVNSLSFCLLLFFI